MNQGVSHHTLRLSSLTALLAVTALLVGPSAASANITLGPATIPSLADAGNGCGPGFPCVMSDSAINERLVASPVNGRVVRWGITTTSVNTQARLRVIRVSGTSAQMLASSPTETATGPGGAYAFASSVPISIGDRFGVQELGGSIGSVGDAFPLFGASWQLWGPVPDADSGSAPLNASGNGKSYLVNAEVEPTNDVTVDKITKNKKKGTATLTASVPNPGTLRITEGPIKPQTIKLDAPDKLQVTLRPTKKVKSKLLNRGRVAGGIDLLFTPSFGTQGRETTKIVLRLSR